MALPGEGRDAEGAAERYELVPRWSTISPDSLERAGAPRGRTKVFIGKEL